MKYKNCIKSVSFILLFVFLFTGVTRLFTVSADNTEYLWMTGVYDEPDNSLDGVYLGSSNCFAYWNSNAAYKEYGITVYPYACSSQPLIVTEYLIKEVRKTQPNAFFIVNISTLGEKVNDIVMHRLLDYMKFSKNKLELTDYLCELNDLSFEDRIEYYLPMFRYHEKWSELTEKNFDVDVDRMKGANTFKWHLGIVNDFTKKYKTTDEFCDITDGLKQSLNSLLDYCDNEKLQVLFVSVPRAEDSKKIIGKFNTVSKIITERGYPVIDLVNHPEKANIYADTDFYNQKHTNIHGALKFTYYISDYIVNNFKYNKEHSKEIKDSWDSSYNRYLKILDDYVLDFELKSTNRDFTLSPVKKIELDYKSGQVSVLWESIENADGYMIYKKEKDGSWASLGSTTGLNYSDKNIKSDKSYSYTVVPYSIKNGEKMFGNYLYNGKEITVKK